MVARRPILSLVLVALASLAAVSKLAFVTSPLQSDSSSSRRAGLLAAIAVVGVGPAVLPDAPAFAASSGPPPSLQVTGAPDSSSSRRAGLLAAIAIVGVGPAVLRDAPAFAASSGPPPSLQVTGAPERRAAMAGIWTIVPGKELNQRAVYKRDGEDYYLMVNDCGGFQVSDSITGECKGFATEKKGAWTVDGVYLKDFKLKPVKKNYVAAASPEESSGFGFPSFSFNLPKNPMSPKKKGAWTVDGVYLKDFKVKPVKKNDVAAASPEESSGFGFPSFSFNLPKNPTEPQTESQVLDNAFRGEDTTVLSYIKSKGGDSFLENVMKLSDDEDKVASSLEARLAARR
eukprot:CAMPEP_0183484578 /NCGR_PEP_ID=MMETSP0370-20130417/178993_1 /TAXON_ID=268820 /ORGANISM="Peridinium aciculiferum, Strain PAER-2" /LENGTH=343 /DNA_ID=CAMNT_0025677869 /DNA_START=71 /DNA_END=1103 /DNA_ORIENTATION=-